MCRRLVIATSATPEWELSRACGTHMRASLALDALEMAVSARLRAGQAVTGLVHHSDRGGQYLAIRYTARLAEAGAIISAGSKGEVTTMPWRRRSSGCTRPS